MSPTQMVQNSPFGVAAKGVEGLENGIGWVAGKVGQGYNALVGQPTAATQSIANATPDSLGISRRIGTSTGNWAEAFG